MDCVLVLAEFFPFNISLQNLSLFVWNTEYFHQPVDFTFGQACKQSIKNKPF